MQRKGLDSRAAGYVRVSDVGGRGGDSFISPDMQRDKIEAWAAYRDYTIVEWYVDLDVSGRTGVHRPAFERMMAAAAAGHYDAVCVYRLTRFARSVSQAAARYAELREHGVALVSVTEDIDTTTASGGFMQNMLFAMAEFESDRIGEEWRNVHANRRRRGLAHVANGVYGYDVDGAVIAAVNEHEADGVRLAYQLRITGAGMATIGRALDAGGWQPRHGQRWSRSSVEKLLGQPLYAGLLRFNGELVDGAHEPIIDRVTWQRVQDSRRRLSTQPRGTPALLSGLLICSGCGYRMGVQKSKSRPTRYRCVAQGRARPCPHAVSVLQADADAWVEASFLAHFDAELMPNRGRIPEVAPRSRDRENAARLAQLDAALNTIAEDRYVHRTLPADEYARLVTRYTDERAAVASDVNASERRQATPRAVDSTVLDAWPSLPVEARRRALMLMVERIVVQPSAVRGEVDGRLTVQWKEDV